jgi:hypothetical protein
MAIRGRSYTVTSIVIRAPRSTGPQVSPVTGTTTAGFSATGVARKVAVVVARCTAGASATGVARKVAPQA